MSQNYIFTIEFTCENMTAAFVSLDGQEEGTAGFDLCDFMAGESQPMDKLLALLAAKASAAPGTLAAVAVSLPCDIDRERSRIIHFSAANWLSEQPLPELLHKAFNLPVVMERRAVVQLACDRMMLGLPEDSLILGCYVDMHFDTAIWHCGAPLRGKNGIAGTIAHMPVQGREDLCFCGKTGCVDLYGAGVRLRQMHTMIFPDMPMDGIFTSHGDHPLILDYLSMMAYPIAVEADILDPEFIVIGGEVPGMPDFPRGYLEDQIRRLSFRPDPGRTMTFLPSPAGALSGVVCTAQYALTELGLGAI